MTDATGNLIDINTATGQRIYPVFPDYGTTATASSAATTSVPTTSAATSPSMVIPATTATTAT